MSSPTAESTDPTIYIVYNAKSTLLGKVNYVYRKKTCPDPAINPACAACELTHGPSLSLSESSQWKQTKACIGNANLVQIHLDERPGPLFEWMKEHALSPPAVIIKPVIRSGRGESENFKVLLTAEDLAHVRNDHGEFLGMLKSRIADADIPNVTVDMP
ncbi:hypothetical protein DTO027I6_9908 [Penicillium roqueforti]|nr:hypothetical protein CBS147337_9984 [Penicillium roqueforti]KAI3184993.1 hypothetical protein DTO027I6_9908 [Penicillium roqueforti]